jgi:hypothetical protein
MTAAVFVKIAEYFKLIHTDLVWPTAKLEPPAGGTHTHSFGNDRLPEISEALVGSYRDAVQMFGGGCRPCVDAGDCINQGDICEGGVCKPKPGAECSPQYFLSAPCVDSGDCINQGDICLNGICVPKPLDLDVVDGVFIPNDEYHKDLNDALVTYYARIQDVLAAGLGKDQSKLPAVRDYLMKTYARLAAACDKNPCQVNGDCAQDKICIKGRCVPYPFRLVFRRPGATRKAPWTT